MRENFEKLIEYIINDEKEKAQELFHQYVVSQSREIYNELVAEDEMSDSGEADDEDGPMSDGGDDDDGPMSDSGEGDTGSSTSGSGLIRSSGSSGPFWENEAEMDMDDTDDMMGDISADEEGMDQEDDDGMMGGDDDMMGGDEDQGEAGLENRVVDLEDALDELKAEFDRLMSDDNDMADEGVVREYTEKVSVKHTDGTDSKGSKSPVAGKNNMGGSAKNIAQGGTATGSSSAPKSGDMGVVDPRAAGKTAFGKKAPSPVTKDQATGTKSPIAK